MTVIPDPRRGPSCDGPATVGVSVGGGLVHCVLVMMDDHERLTVDARVIDVDPMDRFRRADRITSGIDLMADRAADLDVTVAAIGVTVRPADSTGMAARGRGPRRQIHLVAEPDAVAQALAQDSVVAGYDDVVVVDCGDSGISIYRVDLRHGEIGPVTRSSELSGTGVDALIADHVRRRAAEAADLRRADVVSACRTAKEEVAEGDSTTVSYPGGRYMIDAATMRSIVGPAVERAVGVITDHCRRHGVSAGTTIALVGGLARMPSIRATFAEASTATVVTVQTPELVGAIGAALAVRPTDTVSGTTVFVDGRPHRSWSAVVPTAVVCAFVLAAALTAVAVGAAVDHTPLRDSTPTVRSTIVTARPSAAAREASTVPGRRGISTAPVVSASASAPAITPQQTLPTVTTYPTPLYRDGGPRGGSSGSRPTRPWATTELTTPSESMTATSTISPDAVPPNARGSAPSDAPSTNAPRIGQNGRAPDVRAPDARPPARPAPSLTPYPLVP